MRKVDGHDAVKHFTGKGLYNNEPELVVAYHPGCEHCHAMAKDYIKLANKVNTDHAHLNVIAVNMKKTLTTENELNVEDLPTIRLYKDKNHKKFKGYE